MLDKLREMSKNVLRKVLMRGDDQISFIFTFQPQLRLNYKEIQTWYKILEQEHAISLP